MIGGKTESSVDWKTTWDTEDASMSIDVAEVVSSLSFGSLELDGNYRTGLKGS